jgi:hypothetical protein
LGEIPRDALTVEGAGGSVSADFHRPKTKRRAVNVTIRAPPSPASTCTRIFKYTELRPELLQVGSIGVHNRPRWTNTFAAQYDTDTLFGDARLQLRVNATYRSDQVLTSTVPPFRPAEYVAAAHTGKVWLFDARATLSDIAVGGATVRISAWGRNIFNNKKPNYGADLVAGMTIKYESAPTYGIDLVAEF